MIKIEPWELYSVVTGSVRLDGGAMFGVVPKTLWGSLVDVDAQNRILLATRTLLAVDRAGPRVCLVDFGCGTKWSKENIERFAICYDAKAVPEVLRSIGLTEDDVTDVIITHLHFDHAGALTCWRDEPGGDVCLRYPRANHWIHREHWDQACRPHRKDRASFLPEDFSALGSAGVLRFVEGPGHDPPCPGVEWFVSHGHTPGQLLPVFGVGEQRLMFVGDLMPTQAHLRPAWVMAYDVSPLRTIDEKVSVLRRSVEEGLLLAFPHDPAAGGVALAGSVDRPSLRETLPL